MAIEISGLFIQVFTCEIKVFCKLKWARIKIKIRLIALNSAQVSKLETITIEIN